jgi:hypothetical protein
MLFFGNHLVQRGLVTEAQLVEALDNQRRLTSTIGHVAREAGKLTVHEVLQVLNRQAEKGGRFLEAAVELGYLAERDVAALLSRQRASRPPLGELLVQMDYVTEPVLMRELAVYLAEAGDQAAPRRSQKGRIVTAA